MKTMCQDASQTGRYHKRVRLALSPLPENRDLNDGGLRIHGESMFPLVHTRDVPEENDAPAKRA